MQERLSVLAQIGQKFNHVLKVLFCRDSFIDIVASGLELVPAISLLHYALLLRPLDQSIVDPQSHSISVSETRKDGLLLCGRRVLSHCPDTPIAIADDIVVCGKPDGSRRDAVEEILCLNGSKLLRRGRLALESEHNTHFPLSCFAVDALFSSTIFRSRYCDPSTSGI